MAWLAEAQAVESPLRHHGNTQRDFGFQGFRLPAEVPFFVKSPRLANFWLVAGRLLYLAGFQTGLTWSWSSARCTRQVITSANPEHVICVGKGVAKIVENDLRDIFHDRYSVIPQPNARLSSKKHIANFQRYHAICNPRH
jgi:hypothetical protein